MSSANKNSSSEDGGESSEDEYSFSPENLPDSILPLYEKIISLQSETQSQA